MFCRQVLLSFFTWMTFIFWRVSESKRVVETFLGVSGIWSSSSSLPSGGISLFPTTGTRFLVKRLGPWIVLRGLERSNLCPKRWHRRLVPSDLKQNCLKYMYFHCKCSQIGQTPMISTKLPDTTSAGNILVVMMWIANPFFHPSVTAKLPQLTSADGKLISAVNSTHANADRYW